MVRVKYRDNENVWAIVMFDIPTTTSSSRKEYSLFRETLLKMGMLMIQFSVYVCYFPEGKSAKHLMDVIRLASPSEGRVTALIVSDAEYTDAYRFVGDDYGKTYSVDPNAPEQLTIF